MPDESREPARSELFGPQGRIPTFDAVALDRQSGFTALRKGWRLRHTVALAIISPLAFAGYAAALGAGFAHPVWIVLLGAMSLVAGLIVTSYLPMPGSRQAAASSCGLMPGLMVPGVGVLLAQGSGLLSGVFALAILGLGLVQRLSGASACG